MTRRLKLDDYLPYRLSVASNAVSGLIAGAYQQRFGLTIPEWRLICVLAEDGALTQAAIVTRTVMDKVTVSRAARSLVDKGLLARAENAGDGRSHLLTLSDEGREVHGQVAPMALDYEARLLAGLSEAEVVQLKGLLRRLQAGAEAG